MPTDAARLKAIFEDTYRRIHAERFAGLPITNPALEVEVVGLRQSDDFVMFSLITPWMLNQILVPRDDGVRGAVLDDMRRDRLEPVGTFYVRNVISPMTRFWNMDVARKRAEKEAERLYRRVTGEPPAGGTHRRDSPSE